MQKHLENVRFSHFYISDEPSLVVMDLKEQMQLSGGYAIFTVQKA